MTKATRGPGTRAESFPDRALLAPLFHQLKECRSDGYTLWGHSVDVARRSRLLAAHLGAPQRTQRVAYFAGLLHDLGKLQVRVETLFKPGPLTDEELAHMREHPGAGAWMIARQYAFRQSSDESSAEARREIEGAIRHHHEAWNGRGYPDGLVGDAIPFLARLVSVADWYEALREPRLYRPGPFSHERALGIIEEATVEGQFDRRIVRALLSTASCTAARRQQNRPPR